MQNNLTTTTTTSEDPTEKALITVIDYIASQSQLSQELEVAILNLRATNHRLNTHVANSGKLPSIVTNIYHGYYSKCITVVLQPTLPAYL